MGLASTVIAQTRALVSKHKKLSSNLGWMLGTEVVAKLSRLVTVISLTYYLELAEYGAVMLAVIFHDLGRMLMRCGAGAQIIRASDDQLETLCRNGLTLQWLLCLCLAGLQYLIAEPVATIYQMPSIQWVLEGTAPVFLLYPLVSVRVFLLQRQQQMRRFSLCNCACIITENIGLALLLTMGFGLQAVIISKWLFVLSWVGLFLFTPARAPRPGFTLSTIQQLLATSGRLMLSESIKTLKLHSDSVIAGKLLAPDIFGLYSFAKSAGIGLSQSLTNAYTAALYPSLCKQVREQQHQVTAPSKFTSTVAALFALQGLAALVYVPLLFDPKWHSATIWVTALCLCAVPSLFLDAKCCALRANKQLNLEVNLRLLALMGTWGVFALVSACSVVTVPLMIGAVAASNLCWCTALPWLRPLSKPKQLSFPSEHSTLRS